MPPLFYPGVHLVCGSFQTDFVKSWFVFGDIGHVLSFRNLCLAKRYILVSFSIFEVVGDGEQDLGPAFRIEDIPGEG